MEKNYTKSNENIGVLDAFNWESVQTEMRDKFGK